MIVIKLQGGLGNQMFQYAFGRSLAKRLNTELYLDITTLEDTDHPPGFTHRKYELDVFNVKAQIAGTKILSSVVAYPKSRSAFYKLRLLKSLGIVQHLHEKKFSYDADIHGLINGNTFLTGFWQSEKYFQDIADDIRRELKLPQPHDHQNISYQQLIQNKNAVSLHIRRGDYVGNATHPVCGMEYYQQAIQIMNKDITDPVYFIFSDDTEWAANNVVTDSENYVINHNKTNSAADMYLMSQCKHHIIANSSFSWWGAWLNPSENKKVIAPGKWFTNSLTDTKDLIPHRWTII
ncbi:alpha-1,2-fucosyltransferase [Mucilaginibacter sp.]|jgi:hypothetical protein|uniref:alpha-1,2-fucosyltransferase n=1 Tax=Mucilaginibacter sp. TaxID=1882438 RepID=UPI00356174EF